MTPSCFLLDYPFTYSSGRAALDEISGNAEEKDSNIRNMVVKNNETSPTCRGLLPKAYAEPVHPLAFWESM